MDQFQILEREQAEMRKEMRETLHEHVQRIQQMLQPPERRSRNSSSNGDAHSDVPMDVEQQQALGVGGAAALKQEVLGGPSDWAKEAVEQPVEGKKPARKEQLPRKKVIFREVTTATATATTTTTTSSSAAAEMILPEAESSSHW